MPVKKFIKIIIISFIILLLLAVSGVVILIVLVNPNSFKPAIIQAVETSTGRKLSLKGNITWTLFPHIGLRLNNIALSNPSEFPGSNMFSASSIEATVSLLPLLRHQLIIDKIIIDGLNLGLIKNGNHNNWTFNQAQDISSSLTHKQTSNTQTQFELNKITLTNTTFSYTDLSTHKSYDISNFAFKITTQNNDKIIFNPEHNSLKIAASTFDFDNSIKGMLSLNIQNSPNLNYSGIFSVDKLALANLSKKFSLPLPSSINNWQMLNQIAFNTTFKGNINSLTLSNFQFKIANIIQGSLNLHLEERPVRKFNGNFKLLPFSLNNVLAHDRSQYFPELLDKVTIDTNFDGNTNSLKLSNINANIGPSSITGLINLSNFAPVVANENIAIDKLELSQLTSLKGYKVPLTKIKLIGNLQLSPGKKIKISAAKQYISIDNIEILGFDLNNLLTQLDQTLTSTDKVISLNNLQPINNSLQVSKYLNNIQSIIKQASKDGKKDYRQHTTLGSLKSNIEIKDDLASPVTSTLNGKDIKSIGYGWLNLKSNSLNYDTNNQIIVKLHNPILNYLIFPIKISGKTDNIYTSIDWFAIQEQLLKYLLNNSNKGMLKQINKQIDAVGQSASTLLRNIFK